MKRIRVFILTLALSISMLAPEFSMLPAAYAQDETPALTQAAGDLTDSVAAQEAPAAGDLTDNAVAPDTPAAGDLTDSAAVPVTPAAGEAASESGAYDVHYMTDLYDAEEIVIPDAMKEKITLEPAQYGDGLLFTGKVEDLNSTRFTIDRAFDFNAGSVGRLCIDGLRDKDRGMTVEVEVYLDDSETPVETIPLKKQMGKKEWANRGDKSVSLGSGEISGKHKVSLLLRISGKKDSAKTTVMLRSLQFCKTTVPVMYFNIDESEGTIEAMNNSEDHSVECCGSVDLVVPDAFNADTTFKNEYGEQESLSGLELEYIRGRGNSTWMDDKKPYKVKFDKAQDLFGFGKNKHWVLLANRYDNSLIRNRMTYWLGQQLGMEYTPQCVPVEVVMNGEFYGSYLLCEQIRVGTGRVTIDDLDDQDPLAITDDLIKTGGYLLSLDWDDEDEDKLFFTKSGMNFYIESPEDNAAYFNEYIKAYTQKVENAIFSSGFTDEEGHPYTDYLDMDAAVDYWWVQEFSANGDAYGSGSTYLYKKRDSDTGAGKLYWGPLWDFDFVAWGDLDYETEPVETLDYTSTPWFDEMKSDPVFISKVKARWSDKGGLKEKLTEITREGGLLDKYIAQMETSYKYDHDLWGPYESELTEYKDEIEQLRTWINKRMEYVDKEVSEMSADAHHVKFIVDGKVAKEADVTGVLRSSDFPEPPEKKGMVFVAWTDKDDIEYYAGSRITEDLTLTAVYVKEDDAIMAKDIFFKSYDVYYPVYTEDDGEVEDFYFMEYEVMPEGAMGSEITWTSSNPDIVEPFEDGDGFYIKAKGDVTITATLASGVSRSFNMHIVGMEDMNEWESTVLDKESLTLKAGEYSQIMTVSSPMPCEAPEFIWVSSNEDAAYVDDFGVVTAVAPGKADILAVNLMTREVLKCKVTVAGPEREDTPPKKDEPAKETVPAANTVTPENKEEAPAEPVSNTGRTVKVKGSTYKITSDKKDSRTAMLVKAKNAKTVTIPAAIKLDGKKYSVTKIKAKAFAKSKAKKVIVKTKKLKKSSVKKSLKGAKVKSIRVKVGKKKINNKYVKKYKKIFTKKNAGRKVKIS